MGGSQSAHIDNYYSVFLLLNILYEYRLITILQIRKKKKKKKNATALYFKLRQSHRQNGIAIMRLVAAQGQNYFAHTAESFS